MAKKNLQLIEANKKAQAASQAKSDFLAKMSHEIRTPMNAITGMAELLLRWDLPDEARGQVHDIRRASSNLITIINDILDFSKIESGRMEINTANYLLSSLINDTVSIIRTRLKDKPIRFFTNIDSKIPNNLFGDEVRMRQILLNLLTNAAKFTEMGYVSLTISMLESSDKQVLLKFDITDTGKGITPEDQEKLFGEFVQVDVRRDRNIEGTGLGLAITKRLCTLMGGSISVESKYGEGSTFTVTIPQGIASPEPFASVDDAENKKVLVYERRIVYARSVCWSLENLGVTYKIVTTLDNFIDALFSEKWSLVLSGYGFHERIIQVMKKPAKSFPGGKKPQLALMVEWGTDIYMPNVRFVSLPVQSISIANVLNGKEDIKESPASTAAPDIMRHIFPSARVLIVDDIITNLKVAEGLLAPYRMKVDTCLTGSESIELVKNNEYDIVFMDHMMSEMDGIEATDRIRKWEKDSGIPLSKQVPVIALTANAISGVREMFIEKGFNDFLAKPIDVSKLDEMLNKWISKDKRKRGAGLNLSGKRKSKFPDIPGVDVRKGISMTGGTEDGYYLVLSIFLKNTPERANTMQNALETDNIQEFIVNVHGIKSASASIGADEISTEAASLEAAGKEGDLAYINDNFGDFMSHLSKLIDDIKTVSKKFKADDEQTSWLYDDFLFSLLRELDGALKSKKAEQIESILEKINKQSLDSETKEIINKISDDVLMVEYDSAIRKIKRFAGNRL
jgi:CheY-like chemotaxis protein